MNSKERNAHYVIKSFSKFSLVQINNHLLNLESVHQILVRYVTNDSVLIYLLTLIFNSNIFYRGERSIRSLQYVSFVSLFFFRLELIALSFNVTFNT